MLFCLVFTINSTFLHFALTELICETIDTHWWNYVGSQKTCFMTKSSSVILIKSKFSFTNDPGVTAITFKRNFKIFALPEKVQETFPNVQAYSASSCSIKSITFENFEKLNSLVVLWLYGNYIEYLNNEVFADLTSLEVLDLSEVRIALKIIIQFDFYLKRIKQT